MTLIVRVPGAAEGEAWPKSYTTCGQADEAALEFMNQGFELVQVFDEDSFEATYYNRSDFLAELEDAGKV